MRTNQPTASPDWSQGAHSFCPKRGFCRHQNQLHRFMSYLQTNGTPVLSTLLYP